MIPARGPQTKLSMDYICVCCAHAFFKAADAKHSLSTGASREAPVDKRAHRLNNAVQCEAKQSKAKQNTHCPQVLRAKHLWTKASLGKSRQVGHDSKSWSTGSWQLG